MLSVLSSGGGGASGLLGICSAMSHARIMDGGGVCRGQRVEEAAGRSVDVQFVTVSNYRKVDETMASRRTHKSHRGDKCSTKSARAHACLPLSRGDLGFRGACPVVSLPINRSALTGSAYLQRQTGHTLDLQRQTGHTLDHNDAPLS